MNGKNEAEARGGSLKAGHRVAGQVGQRGWTGWAGGWTGWQVGILQYSKRVKVGGSPLLLGQRPLARESFSYLDTHCTEKVEGYDKSRYPRFIIIVCICGGSR